jgi:hypothetical protein
MEIYLYSKFPQNSYFQGKFSKMFVVILRSFSWEIVTNGNITLASMIKIPMQLRIFPPCFLQYYTVGCWEISHKGPNFHDHYYSARLVVHSVKNGSRVKRWFKDQRWAPDTFFGIRYSIFQYFNAGIRYRYSDTFQNSGVRYSILRYFRYFTKTQENVIFMRKKASIYVL